MDNTPVQTQEDRTSHLHDWYEKSSVRSTPRRLTPLASKGELYYSPDLVPLVSDSLISQLPESEQRAILARRLMLHLQFTIELEQKFVNACLIELAERSYGFALASSTRFDAFKIYCDEAYHALFSADLAHRVAEESRQELRSGHSILASRLDEVSRRISPTAQPFLPLFFAIVSETLISGTLSVIPRDARVKDGVREVIADHARDERTHHAYFSHLLLEIWDQIDPTDRQELAGLVPRLVAAFLEPDWNGLGWMVEPYVNKGRARRAIHTAHDRASMHAGLLRNARSTAGLFRRVGAQVDWSAESCGYGELGIWGDLELDLLGKEDTTWQGPTDCEVA